MLFRHKEYVRNHVEGFTDENIILIENGDVLEMDENFASVTGKHDIGFTFIDDSGFAEIGEETIRERRKLAYDGVVSLVVKINSDTKELAGEPQISISGVIGVSASSGWMKEAKRVVTVAVEAASPSDISNKEWFREYLRVALKRFVQKQTGTKPVIIPTVVEV
jgi:ribonuclease J